MESDNSFNVSILRPGFQSIEINDESGQSFHLVVESDNPGPYEQWFITTRGYQGHSYLLIRLLSGGGTLIDLGANIGTVCLPVAKSGSRVVAIELLPRNVQKLRTAVQLNELEHVRVVEAAVSDFDGTIGYDGTEAWGHILGDPTAKQAQARKLDTILEEISAAEPDFLLYPIVMKIDVEGHELNALQGAEKLLREHRPTFIFESIHLAYDPMGAAHLVKKFVAELGYSMFAISAASRILSPYTLGDPQIDLVCDYLAVPTERVDTCYGLTPEYQIRPRTFAERMASLEEMTDGEAIHRRHAAAIVPVLEEEMQRASEEFARIKAKVEHN